MLLDSVDDRLQAIEMLPEEAVDPCVVLFSDYRQVNDRLLPGRMEVRHGDQLYAEFPLERFELEAKPGA